MRIVFIGAVDFSYHCLGCVVENSGHVCGLVSSKNSSRNSDYRDLTPLALEYRIPVHYCDDINAPETLNWIAEKQPNIIFCLGWSRLLKKELLSIPRMGIVSAHPALLPQNRGRHPIIWALVLGLKERRIRTLC